jgi:hypothetical protein
LSIVDIKAHGNSVTERATILAALRCPPNQAFPLSLFPCEESACLSCPLGTCLPFTMGERTRFIIGGQTNHAMLESFLTLCHSPACKE